MSKVEDKAKEFLKKLVSHTTLYKGTIDELEVYEPDDVIWAYKEGYEQAEKELIDKAIGWIEEINNHHHIMRYSDSCEPPLSELIEWFKNYMKEENINSK